MTQWALLIFLIVLLTLCASAWVIKYPNIIKADAILTDNSLPKKILVEKNVELVRLFCRSGDTVSRGQAICEVKDMANSGKVINSSVVKSPANGTIVFISPMQEGQFLQVGSIIGLVKPMDSYYALVTLPQANLKKIDIGQKVQLRFDAYPYQEFGFVEGELTYISPLFSGKELHAEVEMLHGLVTNFKKEIPYRSGLQAQAIIITDNRRLLQKFFVFLKKEF